jgi:uncharacterized protein YndB with AHSA1/START domain
MTNSSLNPDIVLETRRTIRTSREKAFHAWTDPSQLRKWFAVAEGFTTPLAEVDLKVGGRYRLGMKAPGDNPLLIVGGVYQEILPPEKLVFTWQWESANPNEPETLVTVEFYEREGVTEIVLKHELFKDVMQRNKHGEGWAGCLDHLERLLER